jgi:hypothetical protein
MAIGDTVQAGLMRVDSSPILLAGQAQAKANQAFGNALGQVAEGYFIGKEKKERAKEIEEELIRQGASPESAKAISKNPFLQKEHARKQEADQRMAIEKMRVSANQAISGAKNAQLAALEETRIKEKNEAKAELEEANQITREANQFMRTRPRTETPEFSNLLEQFSPDQIPGTPEFEAKELSEPMGARPPLMASFATDKPNFEMFNVSKAPIEQQLPESFQGQAGRIIDMVDNNQISPEAADLALNRIQGQAMAEQKAAPTTKDLLEIQAKIQDMNIKDSDYGDSESIKTFTPKSNYLQLGTTKMPISGRLGNEAEAIKYKDEYIPAFNQTNAAFEKLLALGQKRADGWYMSSEDKDQALSYIKTLQGNIREDILGPGTVQESERVILDNIVKDPTKAFTLNGAAANMEILRNLRQTIFDRLENRLGNFGLKLGESKSPNSPQAKPDYTDETSTGNKIRTFDFDNPNQ